MVKLIYLEQHFRKGRYMKWVLHYHLFKGAMQDGDYGFFVNLSDYSKNAKVFLESNPKINAINGVQLAELLMKYYSNMSEKYKKIIPMKQVYIPVDDE